MMRNGILLAEDTPANIMQRFNCDNLEDAFLVLCQKHGTSEEADTTLGRVTGQKMMQQQSQQSEKQQSEKQQSEKQQSEKQQSEKQQSHQSEKHHSDTHQQSMQQKKEAIKSRDTKDPKMVKGDDTQTEIPVKRKLKRNLSFHEQKPDTLIGKLTFTSQIRMKALLTKNLLQLIRQPS